MAVLLLWWAVTLFFYISTSSSSSMASLLHRLSFPTLLSKSLRSYTNTVSPSLSAPVSSSPRPALPYFVPRNSNGNLPFYSDIRNNGTRTLILIRNVDGMAHVSCPYNHTSDTDFSSHQRLAQDIRTTLFNAASSKAARAKVEIKSTKDVVISGNSSKLEVIEWLKARGF